MESDSEPQQEASAPSEISTVYGKCRCCLQSGYMTDLWEEHQFEGIREVFGEMILETFVITWEDPADIKPYICEWCVERLRDAASFKKQVIACQQVMDVDTDPEECEDDNLENDPDWEEEYEDSLFLDSETEETMTIKEEALEIKQESMIKEEPEYEGLEFLDEYAEVVVENADTSSAQEPQSSKKPRKRKTEPDIYKTYTESDMRSAVRASLSDTMSIAEAARLYKVKRKTLTARVFAARKNPEKMEAPIDYEKQKRMDSQYTFTEEVKLVLSYTTAVAFRARTNKYYCALCRNQEHFECASDLRVHSRSHDDKDLDFQVDRALRPYFLNEILRVDITNLHCKVCSTNMPMWNDMFDHLKDVHSIELDQSYTRLIPYKLNESKPVCALCKTDFPNFQYLDGHMNAHYCNYMCSQCGEPFVTEGRLKHHQAIHNTGKFPCKHCGKMFQLEKYRKKHVAMVHKEFKMFKCECGEGFHADIARHQHIVKHHPEKIRMMTCEFCGKSFDWRPYYLAHLRKTHIKNKAHKCRYCPKGFVAKHELKQHELRHTGKGTHVCIFCMKNFVTAAELRKHSERHYINGEFDIVSNEDNPQKKTIIVRQGKGKNAQSIMKIAINKDTDSQESNESVIVEELQKHGNAIVAALNISEKTPEANKLERKNAKLAELKKHASKIVSELKKPVPIVKSKRIKAKEASEAMDETKAKIKLLQEEGQLKCKVEYQTALDG